jgi:hypothetical protein
MLQRHERAGEVHVLDRPHNDRCRSVVLFLFFVVVLVLVLVLVLCSCSLFLFLFCVLVLVFVLVLVPVEMRQGVLLIILLHFLVQTWPSVRSI